MLRDLSRDVVTEPVSPHMLSGQPEAVAEYAATGGFEIRPFWHGGDDARARRSIQPGRNRAPIAARIGAGIKHPAKAARQESHNPASAES